MGDFLLHFQRAVLTSPYFSQQLMAELPFAELDRSDIDRLHRPEKKGSRVEGKHAAHINGLHTFQEILSSKPGPKVTNPEQHKVTAGVLNGAGNLRLKTETGNLVHDEAKDKVILTSVKSGAPLTAAPVVARASSMFRYLDSSPSNGDLAYVQKEIGALKVDTGKPGPKPTIASLAAKVDTSTDRRSSLVKTGAVTFTHSGAISKTSAAVQDGRVLVKKDGSVDGRSSAVKQGTIIYKPSASGTNSKSSVPVSTPVKASTAVSYTYPSPSYTSYTSPFSSYSSTYSSSSYASSSSSSSTHLRRNPSSASSSSSFASSSSSGWGTLKADGTPDMRYKSNRR
jgi:hypothetical protein